MNSVDAYNLLLLNKEARDAVEILPLYYTGATLGELAEAIPRALRKLDLIVEREGDADGARVEPKYLAMLIVEVLRSRKFSFQTLEKEKKHEAEAVALLINAPTL